MSPRLAHAPPRLQAPPLEEASTSWRWLHRAQRGTRTAEPGRRVAIRKPPASVGRSSPASSLWARNQAPPRRFEQSPPRKDPFEIPRTFGGASGLSACPRIDAKEVHRLAGTRDRTGAAVAHRRQSKAARQGVIPADSSGRLSDSSRDGSLPRRQGSPHRGELMLKTQAEQTRGSSHAHCPNAKTPLGRWTEGRLPLEILVG